MTGSQRESPRRQRGVRPERDGVHAGISHGRRANTGSGAGNTSARCTAAGHMSMYRPCQQRVEHERAAQDEIARRRAQVPRHAAAGRPGGQDHQPGGRRHVRSSREDQCGDRGDGHREQDHAPARSQGRASRGRGPGDVDRRLARRCGRPRTRHRRSGARPTDPGRGPPMPPSGGHRPPRPDRRSRGRAAEDRWARSGRRPSSRRPRRTRCARRRTPSRGADPRTAAPRPATLPATATSRAGEPDRLRASPLRDPSGGPTSGAGGASLGVVATPGDRASWFRPPAGPRPCAIPERRAADGDQ